MPNKNKPVEAPNNKPKRKSNGHFPQQRPEPKTEQDFAEIGDRMRRLLPIYQMPKVKSDEELEQRLVDFFRYCANSKTYPTVEAMTLYCGYTREWMNSIELGKKKGFSPTTADVIKKAKHFMSVYDADMVTTGKLNPVVYIFRSKNYYGMKDQQDVNVTATANGDVNTDDIKQRYIDEYYPIEALPEEVHEAPPTD